MGFGTALDENRRLFLVVLRILTNLPWEAITHAYSVQFPPSQPKPSDCRTQWCRRLQSSQSTRTLEAGQLLPSREDAQARAYLQTHGLQHLNGLGEAYLNAPAPQAGPAAATCTATAAPAPLLFSGNQASTLPPVSDPVASPTTLLSDTSQAPRDTTMANSADDIGFWLSYPEYQNQSQMGYTEPPQEVDYYYQGDIYPETTGEEQPPEDETAFGNGPYGGYSYPSP